MFTFGREHEKKCAIARVHGEKNVSSVGNLIDTIHNLLEHKTDAQQVVASLEAAFIDGGSGVWEQTAIWLKRLSAEYPEVANLWLVFAKHPYSRIRFRVACCLDCMPVGVTEVVTALLASDASQKVRQRLGTK